MTLESRDFMLGLSAVGTVEVFTAVAVVLIVAALIIVPVWAIRRMRRAESGTEWQNLLAIAMERAGPEGELGPVVSFRFHTYTGFLADFSQHEHCPSLPSPVALKYLWQLHRYNIAGCTIPYPGVAFVPLLSTVNYLVQRRAIKRAARLAQTDALDR
jgi:hypothetical protein